MKIPYLLFVVTLLLTTGQASDAGATCDTSADCPSLTECIAQGAQGRICVHKPLFPLTTREILATIFILTLNALLTAGGVGAGAAYLPYIQILFNYTLSQSLGVAYCVVFGGGLGNILNIIRLKNKKTGRFMTNYNINMIVLPALMIGINIGLILQRIFPPLFTNVILLLVLIYSFTKNFIKLKMNLEKEKKERAALKTNFENYEMHILGEMEIEDPLLEKRELIYKKEKKFPFHKVRELFINVAIIIGIGLIRGTKYFKPLVGVNWSCSWDFLWFTITIVLFALTLSRNISKVLRWQGEKQAVGYEFPPEEPLLDDKKIRKLTTVALVAGTTGAIVALGGSMIVGPTLLDMRMPPAFSAATTSVFMIFSMFNAMFNTILNGKLTGDQLIWFLPLSFIFSYASSKAVNWYVKKTGKQSTIILLIMGVTSMGLACVIYTTFGDLINNYNELMSFSPVC